MFQSLIPQSGRRPVTQPLLSFALHAMVIYAAVRGTAREDHGHRVVSNVPVPVPFVVTPRHTVTPPGPVDPGLVLAPPVPPPPLPGPFLPTSAVLDIPLPGLPQPPVMSPLVSRPPGTESPGARVQVFSEDSLTDAPVPDRPIRPAYPRALWEAGIRGSVEVSYIVGADGRVEPGSFRVLSASHPGFVGSVKEALLRAVFQPGRIRGRPVRVLIQQMVRFIAK